MSLLFTLAYGPLEANLDDEEGRHDCLYERRKENDIRMKFGEAFEENRLTTILMHIVMIII